jgi:hypothetical protein
MFASIPAQVEVQKRFSDFANSGLRMSRKPNRTQAKRDIQHRQREWLRALMQNTGLAPSPLARGAGVSESTVTRILNNPDYTGTLSPESIERLTGAYRVAGPDGFSAPRRVDPVGFSEATQLEFNGAPDQLAGILRAIIHGRNNVHPWRLRTNALEGVGYMPNDIVFVQMLADNQHPRAKDAVCAQVLDYQRGTAETVWRVFDPPFLVGAALDRTAYKPLLVDNERVKVAGVITESFRPQNAA